MAHYFKCSRDKRDKCNICLSESELTWDHIPPKSGINLTEVEQKSILQHLTDNSNTKFVLSQNGVKFRTICSACNNALLGSRYDIALNSFSNNLGNYLKNSFKLPQVFTFNVQPGLIIKSVIGHLLAAKGELEHTTVDEYFREFFLDDNLITLSKYKVFYWVYPYNSIKIIRDVAMPRVRGNFNSEFAMFSTLRYFPIAYLITDAEEYCGLNELSQYCTDKLDDTVDIPINLSQVMYEDWPEYGNDNLVFGGQSIQSSVSAMPRRKIIKQ